MTKSLPTVLCWLTILDNWYSTTLRLKASNPETVAMWPSAKIPPTLYLCPNLKRKQPIWNGSAIIALRPRLSDCFCFFQYLNWQCSRGWRHTEAERKLLLMTSPLSFIVERLPCFSASSISVLTFCLLYFFPCLNSFYWTTFPYLYFLSSFWKPPFCGLFGFLLPSFPIFIRFLPVLFFLELSFLRAREAWDYSQTTGFIDGGEQGASAFLPPPIWDEKWPMKIFPRISKEKIKNFDIFWEK